MTLRAMVPLEAIESFMYGMRNPNYDDSLEKLYMGDLIFLELVYFFRWLKCLGFVLLRTFGALVALWLSFLHVYLLTMISSLCQLYSVLFRFSPGSISVLIVIFYALWWVSNTISESCGIPLLLFSDNYICSHCSFLFLYSCCLAFLWWEDSSSFSRTLFSINISLCRFLSKKYFVSVPWTTLPFFHSHGFSWWMNIILNSENVLFSLRYTCN